MKSYAEAVKMMERELELEWIYCNKDNKLPVLKTMNLLSMDEMHFFKECYEKKIFTKSKVYNTVIKKEIESDYVRHSEGVREKSALVINKIKEKIIKKIMDTCNKVSEFNECIFREDETEWLLYREGDFFKIHQDFERYVCDNMVPYVLLYGLENTILGGETVLYDYKKTNIWKESCRENGAVFFPGHLPHEAKRVIQGLKKCLKLEFFVFFNSSDPMIQCIDKNNNYSSLWTTEFLKHIDCYLSSMIRFESLKEDQTKRKIVSNMAEFLYPYFVALHDRQQVPKIEENYEFLFPNLEFNLLQDVYNIICIINKININYTNSHDIFIAKINTSWKWYHETIKIGNYIPLICLWTKNSKHEEYRLENVYSKNGRECYSNYFSKEDIFGTNYVDLEEFSTILQKNKILEKERRRSRNNKFLTCKYYLSENYCNEYDITKEKWDDIYIKLRSVQPNDKVVSPKYHSNSFERMVTEMCNCEDAGFESYIEDVYITLYIQIRWILIKLE